MIYVIGVNFYYLFISGIEEDDEVPEVKITKGKRGQKKAVETPDDVEGEPQDTGESTNKRRRKPAEEKGN